uniref:ABC transporter ATP-binding protein n=1 Tax=Lachnospira sp. TaxID=2049031 RepID=UPI004025F9F0
MDNIIQIRDLTFAYAAGDEPVLSDINIDIGSGEFVIIMGSSGSGKTTLLKMLKRNMIPAGRYSGRVYIYGKEADKLTDRENAAGIGYVSQDPDNQIVTDKVWHELAFGLENLGMDNVTIRKKVAEKSEYFGITGWYDREVSKLSGGQKQILNLASVMVMQPGILLLDEPTANLDPLAAIRFLDVVKRINQELGVTVVMVEHNLEHIYADADRIIAIDKGRVAANSSPKKAAADIIAAGSFLIEGLPVASRLYSGYNKKNGNSVVSYNNVNIDSNNKDNHILSDEIPLTVKEGRRWYVNYKKVYGKDITKDKDKINNFAGKSIINDKVIKKDVLEEDNITGNKNKKRIGFIKKNNLENKSSRKNTDNIENTVCQLKNVSYSYNKKLPYIIDGVDVSFKEGRITAILGGNGAGKSTMLKLIAGIIKPVCGKIISNKRIIMLPQDPKAVFTEVSVEEELAEVLMDKGNGIYNNMPMEDKREIVEQIIEEFGLNDIRKNNPYDISGGQQEKLAIAKVLLLKPEVLLLDEPTNGLDPYFKKTLGKLLKKINADGVTIIIVSHDLEFVDSFCDDVIMLFDRKVAAQDSTHKFLRDNMFYTTNYYRIIK